jgi:phosphohistidine phosphatase
MNVYIMRHGKAAERGRGGKDSERRLTSEGRRKTAQSAEGMSALGLRFDQVLSSPYLRAKETAQIAADVLQSGDRLALTGLLTPGADIGELIEEIAGRTARAENVLLVGHEPMLSELISLLVCGNRDAGVVLKKGALCKLTTDELRPGKCARLEWLLTARQMCAMRRRD